MDPDGGIHAFEESRHPHDRAADWREPELARRLRHRADLFEARLVDPLWRAFTARALQVAA